MISITDTKVISFSYRGLRNSNSRYFSNEACSKRRATIHETRAVMTRHVTTFLAAATKESFCQKVAIFLTQAKYYDTNEIIESVHEFYKCSGRLRS